IERDYSWDAGTSGWQETNEIHFIYDGNVVVEERTGNNVPLVSYTRGLDLSGTLQGAGGIGGLLARTTYGQELPGAPTTSFYHSDGNGNVTAMIYPDQQLAAKYLYDPFGNMLAMSGPLRNFNKYRFSSKEWDDNSGLYYYLYRLYDPDLQRWPNRDPLGDFGSLLYVSLHKSPYLVVLFESIQKDIVGPNRYQFVHNNANGQYDLLGLDSSLFQCAAAVAKCALATSLAAAACGVTLDNPVAIWVCRAAMVDALGACSEVPGACPCHFSNNPPIGPAPPPVGCFICPVNGPPVIWIN
ncbi:MAG: RHS repeat domain-containing protein, partial [Limisphaerales bacterium]